MSVIVCLLYLFAFICFVAAAANVPMRMNLIGAGLAAWVLPALIAALKGVS